MSLSTTIRIAFLCSIGALIGSAASIPRQSVVRIPGPGGAGAALVNTPTLVNETSKASTWTSALGTNPSGQTACTNNSYCLPFADPALSGNVGILSFDYANPTALTVTATDDKSDTFTCLAGSGSGSTVEQSGVCYNTNLTSGAHYNTIALASGIKDVSAKAAQFYNTGALDTHNSCAGSSSTTANCASVTTTAANDLVYVEVCLTGTAVASATAGSGYTLLTSNLHDASGYGCATEYGVASSAGSVTPAMTLASASTYTEFVIAFKAASAGTAPTGWYTRRMFSYDSSNGTTTDTVQFPSSGNFLMFTSQCGSSTNYYSAISDTGNTWSNLGTVGAVEPMSNFYVSGAAADSSGSLTLTEHAIGECNFFLFDTVNAPSSPTLAQTYYAMSSSGNSDIQFTNGPTTVGGLTWLPTPTNGMAFAVGSQALNTSISVLAPSSFIFDAGFYGGMPINGPEPIDQNNPWGHGYPSSAGVALWDFGLSASTGAGSWSGTAVGVLNSGGMVVNSAKGTGSGTSLAITIPSTTSGHAMLVGAGVYAGSLTISKVCLGTDTTCATGTQLTEFSSSPASGSGHAATSVWYITSLPAGATELNIVPSGSASNLEASEIEVAGTGTWSTDGNGTETTNGSASSTTDSSTFYPITGPSITTTGTVDACMAEESVSNVTKQSPGYNNEFVYMFVIYSGTDDAASALLTTSASSHTPTWEDGTSGGGFSASIGCLKQ